jgi:hypothetical protein
MRGKKVDMQNEKKEKEKKTSVRDKIEEGMMRYRRWKQSEKERDSRCNI